MENKLTPIQAKALTIIKETSYVNSKVMSAKGFAIKMWPDSIMHSKSSNQGNGACRGKAAWLCAGSYLSKLVKKGLVRASLNPNGYCISQKGKELLELYEKQNTI